MIATELRTLIIPSSSTIPAIGSRLYIGTMPDTVTYPCAVMYPISKTEIAEANVCAERIQFSIYADTLSSAISITESIQALLKGYYGLLSSGSTFNISGMYPQNVTYMYESNIQKHVEILDMQVYYRR